MKRSQFSLAATVLTCALIAACGKDSGGKKGSGITPAAANESLGKWSHVSSSVKAHLNAVGILPSYKDYMIVGDAGTVLVSSDEGQTWTQKDLGTKANLNSIHFVNNVVYIGGQNKILMSTDGGKSFTQTDIPGEVLSMDFDSTQGEAYFLAAGKAGLFLKATLSNQDLNSLAPSKLNWLKTDVGTTSDITGISFTFGHGLVVGQKGLLLNSDDRAATFQKVSSVSTSDDLNAIDNDYIAGNSVFISRKVSGFPSGAYQWSTKKGTNLPQIKNLTCLSETCDAVGKTSNGNSIVKTIDAGKTFTTEASGLVNSLRGIVCNSTACLAVGENGEILKRAKN